MRSNKIAVVGLGIALAFGVTAGTGLAQAATPVSHVAVAKTASPACTTAKQQVVFAQARVTDAAATRGQYASLVTAQKADRLKAIVAGNVTLVGTYNVRLGSSTAIYNTMDSAVATAQAQVVQFTTAKNAAC